MCKKVCCHNTSERSAHRGDLQWICDVNLEYARQPFQMGPVSESHGDSKGLAAQRFAGRLKEELVQEPRLYSTVDVVAGRFSILAGVGKWSGFDKQGDTVEEIGTTHRLATPA